MTKIKADLVALTRIRKPVWVLSHKDSKRRAPLYLRVLSDAKKNSP